MQDQRVCLYFPNNLEAELTSQWIAQRQSDNTSWFGENFILLVEYFGWSAVSLLFILAQHVSLKGNVTCEVAWLRSRCAPSPCTPAWRTRGKSCFKVDKVLAWWTEVIKDVKGLKKWLLSCIFNSSGELQPKVAEHSISEGGSSCGSALWPSSTLWRYVFYSASSTLPAVITISCLSQQSLLFHTLLLFLPLQPFLFFFFSSPPLFSAHFHHISPTASPYRSKINFFFFFFFAHPAHAITFTLALLHLGFTFHASLICVHAVIYKVSRAQLHIFPPSVDRLSLGNKSSWCGQRSVYPVAGQWVGSCVCVLPINRSSKRPALLQPLGVHQRNFMPAHQPSLSLLLVASCILQPPGIQNFTNLPSSLPSLASLKASVSLCLNRAVSYIWWD